MADNASVSSQNRNRSPSESSPTVNKKKSKRKGGCSCPICLDKIVESTKAKSGQDAIYCEGECDAWLHRRCAGLSRSLFNVLEKSSDLFYCPHCQVKKYAGEIKELKSIINSLSENLSSLQSIYKRSEQPIHEPMLTNATLKPPSNDLTHHQHPQAKPMSQGSYI